MSFRKRNSVVFSTGNIPLMTQNVEKPMLTGTRRSPLDGRLTISTGTRSLDAVLAGHTGLTLGTSLLIEERGTTDFGGILLRYYAAEGVVQGHQVHVLGMSEIWARELPGLANVAEEPRAVKNDKRNPEDRMKIAWRYERLGEARRGGRSFDLERHPPILPPKDLDSQKKSAAFCHDFDLNKRALPSLPLLKCIPTTLQMNFQIKSKQRNSFEGFLQHLQSQLSASSPTTIHRVVIPALLSPTTYQHTASAPSQVLQFLHALRALLRKYPDQLTALITFPISLYQRITGLTHWIEVLSDGVLEIVPFQSQSQVQSTANQSGLAMELEETPQGMIKLHRLPDFHERSGGSVEPRRFNDLVFHLSRRQGLVIKQFSLPPVDGDTDIREEGHKLHHGDGKGIEIEF